MDYEGEGRSSLYQVITGGDQGEILRKDRECITPFDAIPFAVTTPVPVTHRFFGRSIADLVMPVQREKTALKRGALDNLYLHNDPRVEVAEAMSGPNTLDDLLVSRPGGVVRTRQPGGLNWQAVPDITASIYPDAAISRCRAGNPHRRQQAEPGPRCQCAAEPVGNGGGAGVLGLADADEADRADHRRGRRDLFALLHGTIRKHGQQRQTVRLRNAWVDVDPRSWKTRDDMTINVGLGAGGKAQQFAQTMAIANVQKEMLAGGKANLVGDAQLYHTTAELTQDHGTQEPRQVLQRSRRDRSADRAIAASAAGAAIAAAGPEIAGSAGEGADRSGGGRAQGADRAAAGAERRDPAPRSRPRRKSSWPGSRPNSTPGWPCSTHI